MEDLQGAIIFCLPCLILVILFSTSHTPYNLLLSPQDWISDDVDIRQLMIETHALASRENVRPSEFFDDIEHAGFAMFSKEPNIHPSVKGRCVEWSFVKLDKAFFAASQKKVTDQ